MKKTMKRIVSVVLALAMVITSLNYTPKTVEAADYSNLTFTDVTGMSSGTYAYCVKENSINIDSGKPEFYNDSYMKLAYSADYIKGNTAITVNGETKTIEDEEVFEFENGMVTFDLSKFTDNSYYEIVVSSGDVKVEVILRKGNPEEPEEPEEPVALKNLTDVVLYDFRESESGYKLVFKDPNKYAEGDEVTYSAKIECFGYKEIAENVKSGDIIPTKTLTDIIENYDNGRTEGKSYQLIVDVTVKHEDGTTETVSGEGSYLYRTTATTLYEDHIPSISIWTANNGVDLTTDTSKSKATTTIVVYDEQGNVLHSDYGTTKVRGNSTSYADKKAWNISFNKAYDLYGMSGDGVGTKKWSLLANAFDKSLLRNALAMSLGSEIGVPYTGNWKFVDVYVNGSYRGNYMAIESVEVGASRVDIDSENSETYNTDVLVELENNGKNEADDEGTGSTYFTTNTYGQRFVMESPETAKDVTPEIFSKKVEDTKVLFNEFESALSEKDYNTIKNMIDVDSFVNFYLVAEVFKCQDVAFSSTRFYVKNGTLYAGPLWDYDLSSGNVSTTTLHYDENNRSPKNYWAQEMKWFGALMNIPEFKAAVVQKFEDNLDTIKALYDNTNGASNKIDTIVNEIKESEERNYSSVENNGAGWSISQRDSADDYSYAADANYKFTTYDENIEYLRDWLTTRVAWLSQEWLGIEMEEDAPDLNNVDLPENDEGWTKVDGTANDGSTYYYPTSLKDNTITNVAQLKSEGKDIDYGGGDKNTVKAPAFGFAVNQGTIGNRPDSIWIGTNKLTDPTKYYNDNNNVMTIAQSEFALGENKQNIFYVTLRYEGKDDVIIPIKVEAAKSLDEFETPALDDPNWVAFTNNAGNSTNVAVSGDKFYVQKSFMDTITNTNTANLGLYAKETDLEQPGWGQPLEGPMLAYISTHGNGGQNPITKITIDGTVYEANGTQVNNGGNVVYIDQTLFALNGEENRIFRVVVTNQDGTYDAFALKVVAGKAVAPTGLVHQPSEELPYNFVWNNYAGATSYKFYVLKDGQEVYSKETVNTNFDAKDGTYTVGVTAIVDEKESEIATIEYKKAENTEPSDGEWKQVSAGSEYYYYVTTDDEKYIADKVDRVGQNDLYFAFTSNLGFPISATLGDDAITTANDNLSIKYSDITNDNTPYKLEVTGNTGTTVTIWLSHGEPTTDPEPTVNGYHADWTEGTWSTQANTYADTKTIGGAEYNKLTNSELNVTASRTWGNDKAAKFVVDNTQDYWQTGGPEAPNTVDNQNDWIEVDLGQNQSIREIDIDWEQSAAKQYIIQLKAENGDYVYVYSDGINAGEYWANEIYTGSNNRKLDTIVLDKEVDARYIKVLTIGSMTGNGAAIREIVAYGGDPIGEEEPDIKDSDWVRFSPTSDYYYYLPMNDVVNSTEGSTDRGTDLWMVLAGIGNITTTTFDGEELIGEKLGVGFAIPYSLFTTSGKAYKVTATGDTNKTVALYVKKETPKDYTPTGLAGSVNKDTKIATIHWMPGADADETVTYVVTVGGKTAEVTGTTATFNMSGEDYGTYDVVVTAYKGSEEVGTANTTLRYNDPDAIDVISFKGTGNQNLAWEYDRKDHLSWEVSNDDIGSYAIYADGVLIDTIAGTEKGYDVPSYVFASEENPTCMGEHKISVYAVIGTQDAPATEEEADSKNLIGTDAFKLGVNYIYGENSKISIWNKTGVDSKWNFTITDGSSADIQYNSDGSVNVSNINSAGEWQVKAAIYNTPLNLEEIDGMANISFDITTTDKAVIEGLKNGEKYAIGIKAVAEEVVPDGNGGYIYAGDEYNGVKWIYEDIGTGQYYFELDPTNENVAVLHYSLTFEPVYPTYDLLFDLSGMTGKDIQLSDAVEKDIYKVTEAIGTPVPNSTETDNNSIIVNWNTNVPTHLSDYYTYKVYIDDYENPVAENAKLGTEYDGYTTGTHNIKVESYYGTTKTGEATTTVEIKNEKKPNLVISSITVPEGQYYVGDTLPITVVTKNIGTTDVNITNGNLTTKIYINDVNVNNNFHVIAGQLAGDKTIFEINEEDTWIYDYELTENDIKDGHYNITIKAVADDDKVIDELSEDDNTLSIRQRIYPQPGPLTLVNDGEEIYADWSDYPIPAGVSSATISYTTVDGVKHTKNINVTDTRYVFTEEEVLANESNVEITLVTQDTSYIHVRGKALADLVVTNLTTESGVVYVNQENTLIGTVKNIGTAATSYVGEQKVISVTLKGDILEGAWGTTEEDKEYVLNPNEEVDIAVTNPVYKPTEAGAKTISAQVDDLNRVPESRTDNNTKDFTIQVIAQGELTLVRNDKTVTGTWNAADGAKAYQIEYVTRGTKKVIDIVTEGEGKNATINEDSTITYTFTEPLDNQSDVNVKAQYTDEFYNYAKDTAQVDFVASVKDTDGNTEGTQKVKTPFDLIVTVTNEGTAEYPEAKDDLTVEGYGSQLFVYLLPIEGVVEDNGEFGKNLSEGYRKGLLAGESTDIMIKNVEVLQKGEWNLVVEADNPGWIVEQTGNYASYIPESNEDNNKATYTVNATITQEPMDWTPLYTSTNTAPEATAEDGTHLVHINWATDWRSVEYKVLDTSITDIDYKEIVTTYEGYFDEYISAGFTGAYSIVQHDGNDNVTTKISFAQVTPDIAENFSADKESQVKYGDPGSVIASCPGNGVNIFARSFVAGRYYIMKFENTDGTYLTMGIRVPGDLGIWTKAKSTDGVDSNVPLIYHGVNNTPEEQIVVNPEINKELHGSVYFDASYDENLGTVIVYNGNHIAVSTGAERSVQNVTGNWHMTIQYGHVDEYGVFHVGIADDEKKEGIEDKVVTMEPSPIYEAQDDHRINIQFADLIKDLPIHSDKGGKQDSEYYLLTIYTDNDDLSKTVQIPLRLVADIPEIEPIKPNITSGSTKISVSFNETDVQARNGYTYDIVVKDSENNVIGEESGLTESSVLSYEAEKLDVVGTKFTIELTEHWCQQSKTITEVYEIPEVKDGDLEVLGFQMNTNTDVGGVSEFCPSFRTISRASKRIVNPVTNKICGVVEFGTIFAKADTDITKMIIDNASEEGTPNKDIYYLTTTSRGIYEYSSNGKYDDSQQNYFAMTIRSLSYDYSFLTQGFKFRAYAKLDDGSYVYSDNAPSVTMRDIAEKLYTDSMMPTKPQHDFLYTNVLNIVSLHDNAKEIVNAMFTTLSINTTEATYYKEIQTLYNDILWYTECRNGYKYSDHNGTFTSRHLKDDVQEDLLTALNNGSNTTYNTLYEWIQNQTEKVVRKSNGVAYKGCYPVVEYAGEDGDKLYNDADTE